MAFLVGLLPVDAPLAVALVTLLEEVLVLPDLRAARLVLVLEVVEGLSGFDFVDFAPGQPYLSLVSIPLTLA